MLNGKNVKLWLSPRFYAKNNWTKNNCFSRWGLHLTHVRCVHDSNLHSDFLKIRFFEKSAMRNLLFAKTDFRQKLHLIQ